MNPGDPSDPPSELLPPRPSPAEDPGLATTVENVQQDAQDMRTLLHATFVAMIFLTMGVNLFLWKQMRLARDQLDGYRADMERAETAFRKRDPEFRRVVSALHQYASTHPDYGEILVRYRSILPQYLPGAPTLSAKPDPMAPPPASATNPAAK